MQAAVSGWPIGVPTLTGARALVALLKPRVLALLLFAGATGTLLAVGGWPGWQPLALLSVVGGTATAGCSVLNQCIESRTDRLMTRTRLRPLVTGAVRFRQAALLGLVLAIVPPLLAWRINPALALSVAGGAVIYLLLYSAWLKPRTSLNIVIGGAAGSCAVVAGGAAVGAWRHPAVALLALLIFLWTPVHFWSLALAHRDDYARAGIPMLPVASPSAATRWCGLYALASGLCALALGAVAPLGPGWPVLAALATGVLGWFSVAAVRDPYGVAALRLFQVANVYLAVLLAGVWVALL